MIKLKKTLIIFLYLVLLQACQSVPSNMKLSHNKLQRFSDAEQIQSYLAKVKKLNEIRQKRKIGNNDNDNRYDTEELDFITVTGSSILAVDLITNNQVEGVDEGDIVKLYNGFLIILRNGKLFSVDIGTAQSAHLEKIDEIDAFPPGWKHDAYFDEILIDEGVILVIGYNNNLDATELTRFDIDSSGYFSYNDSYIIKSDDYFSEGNYASRLYMHNYTSYIPINLSLYDSLDNQLPYIAKVPAGFKGDESLLQWDELINIENIYYPILDLTDPVLHSFISCPLAADELRCNSVGVISSGRSEYYVNGDFVYLWTSGWKEKALLNDYLDLDYDLNYYYSNSWLNSKIGDIKSLEKLYSPMVYRISVNDFTVDAIQVKGMPVSQFSFYYNENSFYMLSKNGRDESQLLRIPDYLFNQRASNRAQLVTNLYDLPNSVSNRFIQNHLVIGNKSEYYADSDSSLILVDIRSGFETKVDLVHNASRIEAINEKAFIVGNTIDKDMGVTLLSTDNPDIMQQTILLDRLEGESRSHAFNFKYIDDFLLAGITTQAKEAGQNDHGFYYWNENVASDITFIGGEDNFDFVGELNSQAKPVKNCHFSCTDWYGNSRPIFIGERIFALTGDELIEAGLYNDGIVEIIRINLRD